MTGHENGTLCGGVAYSENDDWSRYEVRVVIAGIVVVKYGRG